MSRLARALAGGTALAVLVSIGSAMLGHPDRNSAHTVTGPDTYLAGPSCPPYTDHEQRFGDGSVICSVSSGEALAYDPATGSWTPFRHP